MKQMEIRGIGKKNSLKQQILTTIERFFQI